MSKKPGKKYILVEFPYPSGEGLHMGHLRPYVAGDVYSRFLRMKGHAVMYPIGWDAFGLPAENFAIKKGIHPSITTKQNIANAKKQLKSWGVSFDWGREISTTDPGFYKWTQWIFLQFLKAGLAYEATGLINWCPKDKTGLANEEVIDGRCERCGTLVVKKEMKQWYLKITAYAEKLLSGLKNLDWPEHIKLQQENWIGKSEGAEIEFRITNQESRIKIFTTRPDTLFGATYMVLAPEHPLVAKFLAATPSFSSPLEGEEGWGGIQNPAEVKAYIAKAKKKTELQRTAVDKEKTGVELKGVKAINPATKEEIPVWIADYVLMGYGTGAIMAVPAHDERDFEFAKKYKLPMRKVVRPLPLSLPRPGEGGRSRGSPEARRGSGVTRPGEVENAYTGEGELINSGKFNGMDSERAKWEITEFVNGIKKVQYKLRDWVFSRQRYWGEPIPVIHCENCGVVPVPEKDLPVKLPKVEKYEPTGTGESPLAAIKGWVNVKCPNCAGPAKRETNTMPQWAGSSWYYLRYVDPDNDKALADKKLMMHWLPVDLYFGGLEHTTLHLLYSRFWHLFLYDQGIVPTPEPYTKRVPHGIVLGPDGEKMSKSRGNIVNPDEIVNKYGADVLRMYEMFLGPHEDTVAWNTTGILGVKRFLEKVRRIFQERPLPASGHPSPGPWGGAGGEVEPLFHKTIKKVTEDIQSFKFNTAISSLMILANEFGDERLAISDKQLKIFLKLLAPFAPHLADELWEKLGHKKSIHLEKWPEYDEKLVREEQVSVAVQVNGKLRGTVSVDADAAGGLVEDLAKLDENVQRHLEGKNIKKVVYVPGKIINFVT